MVVEVVPLARRVAPEEAAPELCVLVVGVCGCVFCFVLVWVGVKCWGAGVVYGWVGGVAWYLEEAAAELFIGVCVYVGVGVSVVCVCVYFFWGVWGVCVLG